MPRSPPTVRPGGSIRHIRTSVMYTHFMRGDWERAIESDNDDLEWVTNWTLPILGRAEEAIADYRRIAQATAAAA